MQINKSNINPKKTSFMASQEIEKMALKFLINNNERPKDYHNEKQPKYSTRKHSHDFLAEDLRKTPLQKKTTSKLSPTYEKPKNAQCKTYRNNENLPLPISEFALKSDRLAQISALENANYARSKANPNINNVPFTTMINLAQNQQIYSEEKSNCLSNNIATALLCEICKQSYQPLEFLEHLESCRSQKNLRNMNYENNNINLHNTNHHHHNSYQNLPIYPQVSHFSTTNNNNEQKRTKSFHYQSAQQISHLNQFNSSSGTSSFNSPQMNMQQMNSMMNHTNQRANQMTPIINQANANEFNDPKILNVLDNLNYEKQLIFDKLREVEYKLKHTEDKNCVLNEEKIGLQRHFEGIVSQLNQAQVQLAMSEEEKSENEQNLKQEIKFLITKLLKAKNKLSEEKNSLQSNPNSSINMSGFLNFYQQNKEDSTFGEKNNENENSILNQSIQNIISSSALTVNHNSKSPIIQKFQSKGQILQNKLNNVKKNDNVRSKTPLLLNSKGNRKLEINRNFNEIRTDFVDCLDLNNNNNRFKKKK